MKRTMGAAGAEVLICSDAAELAEAAAAEIAQAIAATEGRPGGFSLALSGGSTPRPVYQLLGSDYRERIAWERIALFWGDERYVPHNSPASNYRMAREAMIDHLPIPPGNVHPVPTDLTDPEEAAVRYGETLQRELGAPVPVFDLIILGLGDDGHTASLFPGSPALRERSRAVAVAEAPAEPRVRITLTFPVLERAGRLVMLVSGTGKRQVLRTILDDPEKARLLYPAAMIRPAMPILWIVDREAYGSH